MNLKKGLGYLYFLIAVVILASVIFSLSTVLFRLREAKALDLASVQAKYFAESAAAYYHKSPKLPHNQIDSLDQEKLINAAGFKFPMNNGGFKIIENKGTIYFLGYSGPSPEKAVGLRILKKQGENIFPWYE